MKGYRSSQVKLVSLPSCAQFLNVIMIWMRGTFPRFRYDQLMNIGWKVMIPIGMVSILANAVVGMLGR
jgi:NADH:ubiquinone oxidoreductase subunit H